MGVSKDSKALVNISAQTSPGMSSSPPTTPCTAHGQEWPGDLTCAQLPSSVS